MFGRKDRTQTDEHYDTHTLRGDPHARGGVSGGAVLTGVVVAFGSMFLLGALLAGVLTALGIIDPNVTTGDVVEAGIVAGMALVLCQFLAYMWGGYTAGRMGRGAGVPHGLLVPLVALLLAVGIGALVTALGANVNLNVPWLNGNFNLPFNEDAVPTKTAVEFGVGVGIASLVAMFIGGVIGGALGHRWHTKLERAAFAEREEAYRQNLAADESARHDVHAPDHSTTGTGVVAGGSVAPGANPGTTTREIDLREEPATTGRTTGFGRDRDVR